MIPTDRLLAEQPVDGVLPPAVSTIARDSRTLPRDALFVAMGAPPEQDRHAQEALAAGAAAVLAEQPLPSVPPGRFALVAHARWAYARASVVATGADRFSAPLLGATGTKGKSTVVHCAWWALGPGAARIGTIGWHDGTSERPNSQTTPPPDELQRFLAGLSPACQGVALEVSSHGADQQRLAGLPLRALAWTGLGRDHLDYHGSAAGYLAAKLRAPRWLVEGGTLVVNADDETATCAAHAGRIAGARVVALGFGSRPCGAHERGLLRIEGAQAILHYRGEEHRWRPPLMGGFNAWNAAAGALLAEAAGVPLALAFTRLASLPGVPGRMELLARDPFTYVDYAHTAESIQAMLAVLRVAHPDRRLAIVFGCGGNKDRGKRAPMGRAAAAADVVVITTDNSRSEAPAAIAEDILAGLPDPQAAVVELDRGAAILAARRLVGAEGVVVVAGKGHETTQDILGRVQPWDDRAFVRGLAPLAAGER